MGKLDIWSRDKRALSPIFATVLLASIIIVFGSVAYYYASNITTTTTNDYVSTLSDSQQAMSERIGFENVVYTSSSPATLKVYILNCGSANNIKINSVFIYDASYNIVGVYSTQISGLTPIDGAVPITSNSLNVGQEGYFIVTLVPALVPPLTSGSMYTIHLITQSGSYFDYDFVP
jgi:FlaG/FlaF family flagellin (archaellin)